MTGAVCMLKRHTDLDIDELDDMVEIESDIKIKTILKFIGKLARAVRDSNKILDNHIEICERSRRDRQIALKLTLVFFGILQVLTVAGGTIILWGGSKFEAAIEDRMRKIDEIYPQHTAIRSDILEIKAELRDRRNTTKD